MKIAIFSSSVDPAMGGYGNITYELCCHYAKTGLDFTLFLPISEKSKTERILPFKTEYVLPNYIRRFRSPRAWGHFFKDIDLRQFSLVHNLFDFPYCVMAARLARKYQLPFITGVQGTYGVLPLTYWPEKYLLKRAYRQAKTIIAPSVFTREQIFLYAKENYQFSIIHNGVNFHRFDKDIDFSDLKEKYKNNKVLLTVGMLKLRKGQDLVIKALPNIKKQFPEIKYTVVGPGKWRTCLADLAKECGVAENVDLVGAVNDEEIVKYFHLCDIYVHTPRFVNLNFEGFGIVYLEASACAKPIVAADSGGIRDAVIEGKTGLIAQNEDVEDIAAKVIQLLANTELADNLGRHGKEYAREHDWGVISQRFIDKYKQYSL